MLDHLHRFARTATFMVGEDNIRSRKAMEKIGGVLREGTRPRLMAGEQVAHVVYEIRRP
jgi:RimJ/RimL family protein N-acetyltransferase